MSKNVNAQTNGNKWYCLKCVLQSSTTNTNWSHLHTKQNMKHPTQTGYQEDN